MAHASRELKAKVAPKIKDLCKKFGVKATLAINNHSTLVLNIKSSDIDLIGNYNKTVAKDRSLSNGMPQIVEKNYIQVNEYHFKRHFSGKAKEFLEAAIDAMNNGNHDRSDAQTDFFDVGWYVNVNIGRWDRPFVVTK